VKPSAANAKIVMKNGGALPSQRRRKKPNPSIFESASLRRSCHIAILDFGSKKKLEIKKSESFLVLVTILPKDTNIG
jgi:hypothetical protein